jgi:Phosphate-starvation-inducible E family
MRRDRASDSFSLGGLAAKYSASLWVQGIAQLRYSAFTRVIESHTLNAEPFLIIGVIASIRRMLVITATSTEVETHPEQFHNTLVELGLLAATVVALASAIWIFRYSANRCGKAQQGAGQKRIAAD